MLAGHCDQIGLIVQHIDEQGFLYVNPIGRFNMQVLIGQPMEALRLLNERKNELKVSVFAVSTVQEEIGLHGAITSAFGIALDVGIAVDVIFATDYPNTDKRQVGDIKLGADLVIIKGVNSREGGKFRQSQVATRDFCLGFVLLGLR